MEETLSFDLDVILHRLSPERLSSYLQDSDNDLERALALYAWNGRIASAFLEDIGRLEVVLRNRFDEALTGLVALAGNGLSWLDQPHLFPGRHGKEALAVISKVKCRIRNEDKNATAKSRIISDLSFGFWRYLCAERHHTSLWVPALASLFPNHVTPRAAARIRSDVEFRMEQLHFLRNRVAHHEPIHRRNLVREANFIHELAAWMCVDTCKWIVELSRVHSALASRPN